MADSGNPALPIIAKPEAFAGLPPPPAAGDIEGAIAYQVKANQVLASRRYATDAKAMRAGVERAVHRSYDPQGLVRQQTVAFVGHYDPDYRFAKLKSIKAPTVVLQGTDDPIVPVESARDIAANIPARTCASSKGWGTMCRCNWCRSSPTRLPPRQHVRRGTALRGEHRRERGNYVTPKTEASARS